MSFAAAVEGAADPELGLTTAFAEPARRARERNCANARCGQLPQTRDCPGRRSLIRSHWSSRNPKRCMGRPPQSRLPMNQETNPAPERCVWRGLYQSTSKWACTVSQREGVDLPSCRKCGGEMKEIATIAPSQKEPGRSATSRARASSATAPHLPDADRPSHSTLTASHEISQLPTRSFCA
jgi:hypothetical protein